MKTFSVDVRWQHKGTKYPREAHVRVKGSSYAIAANKAVRHVKEMNKSTWREPVGSTIRIDLYITSNGKEADDGGRVRNEQPTQP